jgi:UDP-N-acetylmuramate dehydrogenase
MGLPKVRGSYKLNYNLSHLTWFKVGGSADVLFKPEDVEDLVSFLKQNDAKVPVVVLGAGSNLIIRDRGIEGVVVKLGRKFTQIEKTVDGNLSVGAGCLNYNLAKFCQLNLIKDFEFLIGIPGTVGGGIAMNAGAYGAEFKDIVHAVEAIDIKGNEILIPVDQIGFSYRSNSLPESLIFTKVIFKVSRGNAKEITRKMDYIMNSRLASQPVSAKTSGSTFANPPGMRAWELIDKAGLRGKTVGGAEISDMHCNFMINKGNATAADMENLGEYVRNIVKEHSGVELIWEIKRIGKHG